MTTLPLGQRREYLRAARAALRRRDYPEARRTISILRKSGGVTPPLDTMFLQQLMLRQRFSTALAFIDRYLPGSGDVKILLALARCALRTGNLDRVSAALAALRDGSKGEGTVESGSSHALQRQLDALQRAAARPAGTVFRHIAIGGSMFCGSTVLSCILGSFAGCFNVGESHHLVERIDLDFRDGRREDAISGGRFDWDRDDPADLFPCHRCGAQCTVFDADFRRSLADDQFDWYRRIATKAGADILISSDKNSNFLLDKDPSAHFDLLILFKSPEDAWRSEIKHKRRLAAGGVTRPALDRELAVYLDLWSSNYLRLLREIRPEGRTVVIDWSQFVARPEFHLERLSYVLGLGAEPDILSRIDRRQHVFGGNPDVRAEGTIDTGVITLRASNAEALSAADAGAIAANGQSQWVHRLLLTRYHHHFGA